MEYIVLNALDAYRTISQRSMARQFYVSLGKVNHCVKALVNVGMVKTGNFKLSSNKTAYAYLLTANGIRQKSEVTRAFLQQKMAEYDEIGAEIKVLRSAIAAEGDSK